MSKPVEAEETESAIADSLRSDMLIGLGLLRCDSDCVTITNEREFRCFQRPFTNSWCCVTLYNFWRILETSRWRFRLTLSA